MESGITLLSIIHVVVAVLLVLIVLLQDNKGGGLGAFGGGSSQTIFGASGAASFMVKLTRGVAIIFMVTSFGLTLLYSHSGKKSVIDNLPAAAPAAPTSQAPAAPVAPAPGTQTK